MKARYRITSVTHPKNDLHEYVNPHTALKYADALIKDGFEPQISVLSVSKPTKWVNVSYDDMLLCFG